MDITQSPRTGTLTALGSLFSIPIGSSDGDAVMGTSVHIVITGTWTATLTFEGTVDGTTWFSLPVVPITGGTSASTTAANGTFTAQVAGLISLRVRVSAFTSGSATVLLRSFSNGTSSSSTIDPNNPAVQCYSFIADGTDELLISATARKIWGVDVYTIDATPVYVSLYDKATAPDQNDTPVHKTGVPANATSTLGAGNNKGIWPAYIAVTAGLGVRVVTGIANSDDTAVTTAENICNVYWST